MLRWTEYAQVAQRFSRKALSQDRDDVAQDIILRLAQVDARRTGQACPERSRRGPLTEGGMVRVASYVLAEYWRAVTRRFTILSLYEKVAQDGDDDEAPELWETLADDQAIDLEAWAAARTWLLGCPRRLVDIAARTVAGQALTDAEHKYLAFWRAKSYRQLTLDQLRAAEHRRQSRASA